MLLASAPPLWGGAGGGLISVPRSIPRQARGAAGTSGLKALPAVELGRKEEALALRGYDDSVHVPWVGG